MSARVLPERLGPWLRDRLSSLDPVLLAVLGVLSLVGLATLYSAASDHPGRFGEQLRNYALAAAVMMAFAALSPRMLKRLALPVYSLGLVLLTAVLVGGVTVNGGPRLVDLCGMGS